MDNLKNQRPEYRLSQQAYPYDSDEMILPAVRSRKTGTVIDLRVPPVDNIFDLHGSPTDADLIVFFNGNQFMVVGELLSAFRQHVPAVRNIFYETLPPGILVQQVLGLPLRVGNLVIALRPDVITTSADDMHTLVQEGHVQHSIVYTANTLGIMVARGNPLHIRGLADLARPEVRVAMPDPAFEGVGRLIVQACEKTGGSELVHRLLEQKVENGTTRLTRIHHRETAYDILAGYADAGPLWVSEVLFQQRIGNAIDLVTIPDACNRRGTYHAGVVTRAPHPQAAADLLHFMQSDLARNIYRSYGFQDGAEISQ
jgi:molybdate transport system substrate-binding protein